MLPRLSSYEAVCRAFAWHIPARYNIGVDICDKWAADPARLALVHETRDGATRRYALARRRDATTATTQRR